MCWHVGVSRVVTSVGVSVCVKLYSVLKFAAGCVPVPPTPTQRNGVRRMCAIAVEMNPGWMKSFVTVKSRLYVYDAQRFDRCQEYKSKHCQRDQVMF